MAILLVESTILSYGYYFREQITAGFHAAMSNGLQQYGREPSLSSVVDGSGLAAAVVHELQQDMAGMSLEIQRLSSATDGSGLVAAVSAELLRACVSNSEQC